MCNIIINTFKRVIKFCQTTKYMIAYEKYNQQLIDVGFYVRAFLNRVNISESFCSFKIGFTNTVYGASKLRLTL